MTDAADDAAHTGTATERYRHLVDRILAEIPPLTLSPEEIARLRALGWSDTDLAALEADG